MQMYLWSTTGGANLNVATPAAIAGNYSIVESNFSTNNKLIVPVTGDLVLVDDAGAAVTTSLGCAIPFDNAAAIAGKIAVIDRGGTNCNFVTKVKNAQNAGAIGAIVVNNVTTAPTAMGGTDNTIVIPAFMISQASGNLIKAQLAASQTVTGTLSVSGYQPDGDFDNGIISHEYGHGWSIRLAGGPKNSSCLGNIEQMGEGWGDYLGLMLTTNWATETPTLTSANRKRGIGTYALGQATNGNGIRPFPYSYDKATFNNTVTYASVGNTSFSQPHGIGSIWCTMIWDMTWEMILQDNVVVPNIFDSNQMLGNVAALKLVNEGLRLQKCSPSFIDGRDAILKADQLLFNGKYKCSIWKAFARRGLGVNASSGTSSNDRIITEDYNVPTGVNVVKTANVNTAPENSNVTYTLTATCNCQPETTNITDALNANLTYVPNSASANATVSGNTVSWLGESFAINQTKTYTFSATVGAVYAPTTTAIDEGFEAATHTTTWVAAATTGTTQFAVNSTNANTGTKSIFATNLATATDYNYRTTAPTSIAGPATLSFWHTFNTEDDFDGGLVEISIDNGATWLDLGTAFTQNGYNGVISQLGRAAFAGTGAWQESKISLSAYCGTSAMFRFRFISDAAAACTTGTCGWFIDDIKLTIPSGVQNFAQSSTAQSNTNCIEVTQSAGFPKLALNVMLSNLDTISGYMTKNMIQNTDFPNADPYRTTPWSTNFTHVNNATVETIDTAALKVVTGANAIVDWVFVELRVGPSGSTTVVKTRAALLQADGDIVDTDGVSNLTFVNVPAANYYIAVRYRNALGFRTDATYPLSATPTLLNLSNGTVALNGTTPIWNFSSQFAVMVPGDANSDGSIDGSDSTIWEAENGSFNSYLYLSDYNLDGSIDGSDATLWEMHNGKYQELD
jgi:extracellular elastinolytic metalloproteinase